MRLRWPFQRADSSPAPPTLRRPAAAWRRLPPTRSVIGPPPLTIDWRAFRGSQAGQRALAPVLADISSRPSRTGLARTGPSPARPAAPRVAMDGAPQLAYRRPDPRDAGRRVGSDAATIEDGPGIAGASYQAVAAGPASERGEDHARATLPEPVPPRRLEAVATRPRPAALPVPVSERPSSASVATASPERPLPPAVSAPAMTTMTPAHRSAIDADVRTPGRLLLAQAAVAPSVGPTTASTRPTEQPSTTSTAAEPAAGRTMPRHRPGLGAPLELPPPTRLRLREDVRDQAVSGPDPASSLRTIAGPGGPSASAPSQGGGQVVAPGGGTRPSPRPAAAGSSGTVPAPARAARATTAPAVARPLARSIQRAAMAGAEPDPRTPDVAPGPATPPAADSSTVRIDRSSAGATAASELRANAFTSGDTIVLPADHGPLDRGKGRSLLAHELVHVSQQRRLGGQLPHEATAAGQQLERQARSAERIVERLPQPASTFPSLGLPLRSARRDPAADAPAASGISDRDVRQAVDMALVLAGPGGQVGGGSAGAGPSSSSASNGHVVRATADEAITLPQRQDAATPPAGPTVAGDGPASDAELDELAGKLYERVRHRLGRELLLDRERSGLLADPR